MNKKNIFWLILIAIVVILGAYFIINKNKPSGEGSSEIIKIGASLPLTGKSASFGERVKNGLELALADLRNETGADIRVIYEDDKGEAATAVTVARKLIDVDSVKMIIGSIKSDAVLAMAPITEPAKVILFSPTAGADKISEAGDYVFRNIELAIAHGQGAAKYFEEKNIGKVTLFVAQASNAKTYGDVFEKSFNGIGNIVQKTEYSPEATDFRTDIAKAIALKPDAFYLAVASAKDAGILVKQIRGQGYTLPIMASVAAEAKEFFDTAGSSAEGVLVTSAAFNLNAESAKEFVSNYKTVYGIEPDWVSANAYDALSLLVASVQSCGGEKTDCIRDFLYQTKNYAGVGGVISFDQNGDVIKPVIVKVAQEGKFTPVE